MCLMMHTCSEIVVPGTRKGFSPDNCRSHNRELFSKVYILSGSIISSVWCCLMLSEVVLFVNSVLIFVTRHRICNS